MCPLFRLTRRAIFLFSFPQVNVKHVYNLYIPELYNSVLHTRTRQESKPSAAWRALTRVYSVAARGSAPIIFGASYRETASRSDSIHQTFTSNLPRTG